MNQRNCNDLTHKPIPQQKKFKYEVIETKDGIIVKEIPLFKTTPKRDKKQPQYFTFLDIDKKQKAAEKQAQKRVEQAKKVLPLKSVAELENLSVNTIYNRALKLPFISIFSNVVNEGVKIRSSDQKSKVDYAQKAR